MTTLATMVNHRSESPHPNELPYDLDQLREFNSTTSFQQQTYRPDNTAAFDLSHPNSVYNSPALGNATLTPEPFIGQYDGPYSDNLGLGLQYDGYPSPSPAYYPAETQYEVQNFSPPTPRSTLSDAVRRTRSTGRSTTRSESPNVKGDTSKTRVTKPKAAKANKSNLKTPKISAPLSELTKHMTGAKVRDMEAWVNRPLEERQKEVEKRNGYVTRPMNSFMLYRSAYAELTKLWCLQNNHQVVSSVSGESWPMEPPEIRQHYNDLAKTERANHAAAHPSYKFSPSKVPGANRKKKEFDSDEEDDGFSESDDPDFEWKPRNERRGRSKSSRMKKQESSSPLISQFGEESLYSRGDGGFSASWDMPSMGRPLPVAFGSPSFYDHYPYSASPQDIFDTGMDDLQLQPFHDLQSSYSHGGGPFQDVASSYSQSHTPFDEQVDPMLLQQGGESGYNMFDVGMDGGQFGEGTHLYSGEFSSMEPTSQFEEWMEQRNA